MADAIEVASLIWGVQSKARNRETIGGLRVDSLILKRRKGEARKYTVRLWEKGEVR